MTDRYEIISRLREKLEPLDFIYAMWLEGSDANQTVDEYSDIDICVDFEDEYENEAYEAAEKTLSEIAPVDYKFVVHHPHPKLRQRIYHLAGSSEYLLIDFCWQLHSRPKEECRFIKGNTVETATVIFDKADVIQYKDYDPSEFKDGNDARLNECKYRYAQHARVQKYVLRDQYLEAYAYYNRYVLEPLIDLLRLIHTPANADYYLIHVSRHIPPEDLKKLENFAQIASVQDIAERIPKAEKWFHELLETIQ